MKIITSLKNRSTLSAIVLGMTLTAVVNAADLPVVQSMNGISYVSGGIADESQQAMQQVASEFNLQLTFAEKDGSYLADIPVTIKDGEGNIVLETVSVGPLFYASLNPGSYKVMASNQGDAKEQGVDISAGQPTTVVYSW